MIHGSLCSNVHCLHINLEFGEESVVHGNVYFNVLCLCTVHSLPNQTRYVCNFEFH
jgi:hypothetical protein